MINTTKLENRLATFGILFAATMWGLIWYPLRLLDVAGMSGLWSSFVMYVAAALIAVPVFFRHRHLVQPVKKLLLALALAAGIANVAFVVALIEGQVMRVMLLFYMSPIWTVILGHWWLNERLSNSAKQLFALAMLGSLIMLWNPQTGFPWPHQIADWLGLIAGIAFAANNVLARKLSATSMVLKTGVTWWGVVLVSLFAILWQRDPIPDVTMTIWFSAWMMGWFGIIAMTIAVLYGVAKMPVYRSAIIMLFELIVAAVSAWLLTEEKMQLQEWLGGILILLAAYGVARMNLTSEQQR